MVRSTAIISLVSCIVLVVPAGAAVLCQKKSGAIVVRDGCGKREARLALDQFGAVGPKGDKGEKGEKGDPGPAGPPGLPGAGLVVRDGNNVMVGSVVEIAHSLDLVESIAVVEATIEGRRFRFAVTKSGFVQSGFPLPEFLPTLYEGDDCTGPPLLQGEVDATLLSPAAYEAIPVDLRTSGSTGYYPTSVIPHPIRSYKNIASVQNTACLPGSEVPVPGDSSSVFRLPHR